MACVLVTYFSVTGNTEALADAVAEGVRSVENAECVYKKVTEVTNADLLAADGIIVGSPTRFGQMAAEVKKMFDISNDVYGQLDGKVGAAFTTVGSAGCGHETANLSILTALLIAGMVVRGHATGPTPCFDPFSVRRPDEKVLAAARHLGKRIAELADKLLGLERHSQRSGLEFPG